ncbi:MAG: hypothetical protein ABIX28_20920 [Vicinamibacterales bacterium]
MKRGAAEPGTIGGEIASGADDAAGAVGRRLEVAGEVVMGKRQQGCGRNVQAEKKPEKTRPRRAPNALPR